MQERGISMKRFKALRCFLVGAAAAALLGLTAMAGEPETEPATEPQTEETEPQYKFTKKGKTGYLTDTAKDEKVKKSKPGIYEFPSGSGDYYYFLDKQGTIACKCWVKTGKKTYRAGADGKLVRGFTKVGKKSYYMKKTTFARLENKWAKVSGKYYRFGKKGIQLFAFQKVGKYTYYLDPNANGAKTIGWMKLKGKTYYFNPRGRMQYGFVKIGEKTYYFNRNGIQKTGLRTINGSRYYFDPSSGAMKTGWLTRKNKKYYFSDKGPAVTGWLLKGKNKYYFDGNGVMQTGWMTSGARKYYFDPSTGAMYTGKHTIDGKSYDFGTQGYINVEVPGSYSIRVNKSTNVVTIYKGNTPIKAMLCSVGLNDATPSGTFNLGMKYANWHALFGAGPGKYVYGQYCTNIKGNILFHSVYYLTAGNPSTLVTKEYNKLGSAASHGCVRLCCADAYYIWKNIPSGVPVRINYFGATDPLPRPALTPISKAGYDPTDPIPND